MAVEVKVPAVGESVQEGMVHQWHVAAGDYVEIDDVLCELETDKATVEIVSEASGVIQLAKKEGDVVKVGDVLGTIDTDAKQPDQPAAQAAASASAAAPSTPAPAAPAAPAATQLPLSPAVGRMVAEHRVDPGAIAGSGRGGRLTKGDVIAHMEKGDQGGPQLAVVGQSQPVPAPVPTERGERRVPMSLLRRRIAERLVHASNTTAMLTTFNEVDMSAVLELRKQYKESFKEKHGVSLGFMGFFLKAAVEALQEFPAINGWIDGTDIVYHDYYDIGVAVSTERGLVVPVVRSVDQLSLAGVEQAIMGYAVKAREGKISVDDMSGGTFTVSNGGVFGSLMSTPILNPPQSAILGMHKIQQRPLVDEKGAVVARPLMYLAVSYDHRIVDGKEAVQFLVKIKDCIEDPTRLLLGV